LKKYQHNLAKYNFKNFERGTGVDQAAEKNECSKIQKSEQTFFENADRTI